MASSSPSWAAAEHLEANPSPAILPSSMANSSGLFDGELFGDELMDIYNAAVEDAPPGEIPSLPLHVEGEQPHKETAGADEIHPGARVAATAAAIDDGLGAFRPSTSFNDLTNLLPAPSAPAKDESAQTTNPPPVAAAAAAAVPLATAAKAGAPIVSNIAAHVAPAPAASAPGTKVPVQGGAKRKAVVALAPTGPKKRIGPVTTAPLAKSGITLPASHMPAAIKAKVAPKSCKAATKTASGAKVSQTPSKSAPARGNAANEKGNAAVVPETASSAAKATKVPAKAATEADFKNVAQAAVSSLILSTKNGEVEPSNMSDLVDEPVDTTTAHVKALTGANWVAACSGAGAAVVAVNGAPVDAKGNGNRAKRQSLTADERARQNRDRNREHARNTRLRKKAYVEELKRTLTELVAQRDKAELEKTRASQREVEQREVRFRVIEEFLKLRGANESNYASWAAILDANFSLTRPATEFRDLVQGDSVPDPTASIALEKTFAGVPDVMAESNEFASFLQTLGSSAEASEYNSVGFLYSCDRDRFFMDDNHAVLDWGANSMGLTMRGATAELSIRGSIRASFCPASNKLISACLMFDTGAVLSQLQEFMNPNENPTTAEAAAQAASHRADAILDSLQMPHMDNHGVTVVPQGDSSDEGS